MTSVTLSLPSP